MVRKQVGPAAAALTKFEKDFEKAFGADSLEVASLRPPAVVSTGSLTLDDATGIGGYPVGVIVQITGPQSVGKTTLAKIAAANFQADQTNRMVGWIDVERSFNPAWAQDHGVDLDKRRFRRYRPESAEDVSDAAGKMVRSGLFSLVVVDSIGGMLGKSELTKDAEEATVAAVARVVTRMVKQQAVFCDDNKTTLLVINQVRDSISYGGGTTSTGGRALGHMISLGLKARKTGDLPYTVGTGEDKEEVGFNVAYTVEKNRFAPPKRTAVFGLFNQATDDYGPLGIDRALEAFNLGVRTGVIGNPSKGYYEVYGTKVNGKPKTLNMLRAEVELLDKLRNDILAARAAGIEVEAPDVEPEPEHEEGEIQFQVGANPAYVESLEPAPDTSTEPNRD